MSELTFNPFDLVGSVMRTELHRQFISDSRTGAEKYEWLFHCTHKDALLGIIRSRQFWLSNLYDVNDKEESERIDDPDYEKAFFAINRIY